MQSLITILLALATLFTLVAWIIGKRNKNRQLISIGSAFPILLLVLIIQSATSGVLNVVHFDFTLILTLLVLFTLVMWIIGRVSKNRVIVYIGTFFPILLFVWGLRSFLYEPFRIPSGSMIPTLLVGDYIVVNKFAYGIRLPVLHTKIFDTGKPQRGDVVVFRYPPDEKLNYVKRLIGLPGDRITYRNKQLFINGEQVPIAADGYYLEDAGYNFTSARVQQWVESLDGVEHPILTSEAINRGQNESWILGEDEYFMMGDNRDNSLDSRSWGIVPEENLVGKASAIWWNWGNFDRVFDRIE